MVSQATVLGMEPASAARIIGAVGIVFGVLTILAGFFVGWLIGVFADGILTACLYSALLCVFQTSGTGLYLTFVVVNGLIIVGKLVYALILILSVSSYGYNYGYGYDAPGMYHSPDSFAPGPGMQGPGMGLFGMGHDHGYGGGYEYGMYGYEYYRTLMVVAIVIIGVSLIFNAFAEFVILRVWQVSKVYSAVANNNTPRTSTVGAEPGALAYPATYYVDPEMREPIYPTNV